MLNTEINKIMCPNRMDQGVLVLLMYFMARPWIKSGLSLKGHGDQRRFLRTGRQQVSLLSSRRARGRIWGMSVSFTSDPEKVMEQIILEALSVFEGQECDCK